jgi:hypothetical protein
MFALRSDPVETRFEQLGALIDLGIWARERTGRPNRPTRARHLRDVFETELRRRAATSRQKASQFVADASLARTQAKRVELSA